MFIHIIIRCVTINNAHMHVCTYAVISFKTLKLKKLQLNKPYPQLRHKIKMAQRVWVLCTQNLWRELHFEILTMKNAGFHSGETYYPPSDVESSIFELFETF